MHRDVNPSNIFITHQGTVKLIDFGLAKARVRRERSVQGLVKGKIPYLAPEQLTTRPIDRRVDIYALGTTLWETGTMRRLFKRSTDVETLRAIQEAKVPDARQLVEDYPAWLYAIVERALRVEPGARYATAGELRRDLDAFVGEAGATMHIELARLLSRSFPGEEATHSSWRRGAIAAPAMAASLPPPRPVPTVSSSLLGGAGEVELEESDLEIIVPR